MLGPLKRGPATFVLLKTPLASQQQLSPPRNLFLDNRRCIKWVPRDTFCILHTHMLCTMESKSKMKAANDLLVLGYLGMAQPAEKLKDAYKKFLVRSNEKTQVINEDSKENHLPVRSFGTVLAREEIAMQSSDMQRKKLKPDGNHRAPFSVYKDTNVDITSCHQPDNSKDRM
ncbi:hypothetical protein CUMW_274930 [Citrus unshiu]|uniref:Uncharacterized protein n=1 Tax=Citrus unshiu TaxID=55188 RepID=A0A2H5MZ91_CITUN|nr:hypothetical protein CUMW_274930 [Citrus unshiu]